MFVVTPHLAAILDGRLFLARVGPGTSDVLLSERRGPDASGIPPRLSIHADRAFELSVTVIMLNNSIK